MKNDTHLNVLMSYAYMHGDEKLLRTLKDVTTKGTINLMIDSGAFTKFNAKMDMSHVNLNDYCDSLKDMAQYSEKYVMLDVIGDAETSRRNYEAMIDKGLNPMYVCTMFDKDYDYINEAVRRNADICVAGGVTTKGDWILKRFQTIYKRTSGRARIHGLGYFTFPRMLQLNLASIDSSSWKTAPSRFGQAVYFADKRTWRISWRDILAKKIKFPKCIVELLDEYGVTPKMFLNREIHTKEFSVDGFMSIVCNIKLQKYCKRHGLDYFLAVGCWGDLQNIMFVNENLNDLTYEKYLKYAENR